MSVIFRRSNFLASVIVLVIMAVAAVIVSEWSQVASGASAASGGVVLKITSASIPSDLRPVVAFTLTDAQGNPLSIADLDANSLRFTIAAIQTDPTTGNTKYVNYVVNTVTGGTYVAPGGATTKAALESTTQAAVDTGGVFTDLGGGKFTYQFKTTAPSNFDASATHAVGGYATRNARASVSNDVFYFVPGGGPVTVTRQVVSTDACNQCHDPLAPHGGTRRDVRLCVLCHTDQSTDVNSGNTVDFKVLIHKIHRGANLPSVKAGTPYFIGSASHNFSDVEFPQDVRNCTTCHKDAPQADNWKNAPNAAACTACHDNVNPITGENHAGGAQTDATCKNCHTNSMTGEFDLSVPGAHVIPVKSSQLKGVNFDLVSFSNTQPGQNPTVVFDVKDNAGNVIAPSDMSNLSLVLAGPTYEYQTEPPVSESATGATQVGDGTFSYTFKASVPSEASGTWAVGIQGYISETIKGPGGADLTVRDAGFNKVAYGAVTDPTPLPRKQVVALDNCNQCHKELGSPAGVSIHGGSRNNTEYCVLCHNPNHTGLPAGQTIPVTVNFDVMVHRIHTGANGSTPYKIGNTDFSDVRFPGDLRDCQKCHLPGSNLIDFLRTGAQPTIVRQSITPATTTTGHIVNNTAPAVSITQPITAACTACHDSAAVKDHAALQTAPDGTETCIVCHGEGADFAVSKVHARP